jgi:hypothetical protein
MPVTRKPSGAKKAASAPASYKIGPGKAAEKWIDGYIARSALELQSAAYALRRIVKKAVPKSKEAVNPWRIPTFDFHGPLCFLMIGKHHITFGFPRGSWLKDSAGLLEGTGKNLRHVKIKPSSQINQAGLRELLRESAGINRESPLGVAMRPKK